MGILVSLLVLWIAWTAARDVGRRMPDGVEPDVLDAVTRAATTEAGDAVRVRGVRARWVGHALHAEVDIATTAATTGAQLVVLRQRIEDRLEHDATRVRALSLNVVEAA